MENSEKTLKNVVISNDQLGLVEAVDATKTPTLSEYVRDIISIPHLQYPLRVPPFDLHDIPSIGDVDKWLKDLPECDSKSNSYPSIVSRLAQFFRNISAALGRVTPEIYVMSHTDDIAWLCVSPEEMVDCLRDAQNDLQAVQYCSCLRLTAILERSLQDLLWTVDQSTPTVFKDVLQSKTLAEILDVKVSVLLEVLVGPPTSLNIRNLVWHGFGSSEEHPELYSLIIFFTLIIIGNTLKSRGITVSHRQFVTFDTTLIASQHSLLVDSIGFGDFSPALLTIQTKSLELQHAIDLSLKKKYGLATILLLTCFEHLMRVSFSILNDCPARSMTAVSSEYFTTLDHVFEENLDDEVAVNFLFKLLPDRLRCAVYDLLYYPHGLRLRDKLSHMEISYLDISSDIWHYTYSIVSTTIVHIIHGCDPDQVGAYLIGHYVPLYHPLAITLRTRANVTKQLEHVISMSPPVGLEVKEMACRNYETSCEKLFKYFQKSVDQPIPSLSDLLYPVNRTSSIRNLSISSGFKPVMEWCKLIQALCDNLQKTISTIIHFDNIRRDMLGERVLRSRQRKNYAAFYSYKPAIATILITLQTLVNGFLRAILELDCDCNVKKSHKAVLQLSENLSTLADECKWSYCIEFLETFVKSHFS